MLLQYMLKQIHVSLLTIVPYVTHSFKVAFSLTLIFLKQEVTLIYYTHQISFIFLQKLDLNKDGVVTMDEFMEYCSKVRMVMEAFRVRNISKIRKCFEGK